MGEETTRHLIDNGIGATPRFTSNPNPPERCHPAFEYRGRRSSLDYIEYICFEVFSIVALLAGMYALVWLSQSAR